MNIASMAVIVATLLGPILAVQAQKAVERARERSNRKAWVFHTLMATRGARVSAEHVRALNMIDIVFYGKRVFGVNRRTKAESAVLDAWHEYLDHLNTKYAKDELSLWATRGNEIFINLLYAIASDVGFNFERVQLGKGAYSPVAHAEAEYEQEQLRKNAGKVLSGEMPLRMEVTGFPLNEDALRAQLELQAKLSAALEGKGHLSVSVVPSHHAQQVAAADRHPAPRAGGG